MDPIRTMNIDRQYKVNEYYTHCSNRPQIGPYQNGLHNKTKQNKKKVEWGNQHFVIQYLPAHKSGQPLDLRFYLCGHNLLIP